MARKSLQKQLYEAASKVCTKGCISCFDCGKTKSPYTLPPSPNSQLTVCPLLKFDIPHKEEKETDLIKRWANQPTLDDVNLLCEFCEHRDKSGDTEESFSLESCFMTHCINCPVSSVRDCIEECVAEARWS